MWVTVPKPFPKEFREDVVRVYRNSDASIAQVPGGPRSRATDPLRQQLEIDVLEMEK